MDWKKIIKPNIGNILSSLIVVILTHFISDYYGCKPGPCLANFIHNNYLLYLLVFIIIYFVYNLIYTSFKK
jgi:hypothetical protein